MSMRGIVGIGVDMVEINRVEGLLEKGGSLRFVFTENEMELYKKRKSNPSVLAGNFASKEAVSKTFGTGFASFRPSDVEILRDEKGKPYVILHNNAKTMAADKGIDTIHLSISNTDDFAVAYAIAEGIPVVKDKEE